MRASGNRAGCARLRCNCRHTRGISARYPGLPDVSASRVHGEADLRTGERILAEVELVAHAARADVEARLAAWCGERLAAMKRPATIIVVEHLALTASGKVRR